MTWEISDFRVRTTTPSQESDVLYANGRMQVAVCISIKAINKDTGTRYKLSQAELDSSQLVDYYNSSKTLQGDWSYSSQENEFTHTLAVGMSVSDSAPKDTPTYGSFEEGPQEKCYWVSTTKADNKHIGACITQPDGTVISTSDPDYKSQVTLTGKTPIYYTTDNTTQVSKETDSGQYKANLVRGSRSTPADGHWKQYNYYVSTNVHQLLKANIYGYDESGNTNPHHDSRMSHSFAYAPNDNYLNLCFIWDYGPPSSTTAGLHYEGTTTVAGQNYKYKADACANIGVNQQERHLCLTHLRFNAGVNTWGDKWHVGCWFELYDIFGNTGTMSVKWDDKAIVFRDGKP
ncbi:predicted protein [Uncinocarpus reesii 1704]|uniref:Uncharacterized protein n=1 Tax=Uncinocarpus reesii (strain UAMH 1704) TaxID=336963 RepID=C4JTW7_UNCRE|nr:uncharacterized protein UREG_05906 [Uncinocarpus reesii 1704]EEP81064.1 predicted protein [Uncinocarpus reesii 1704]